MLGRYRRAYDERPAKERDESGRYQLTPRETETLTLLSQGLTSHEIGARLGIRRKTVETYIGSIIGKLGAQNRVEALAIALERGLLGPRDSCPAATRSTSMPSRAAI